MSKFFRSAASSGRSSDDSDEETEEISSQPLEVSRNDSHDASGISLGALAIDRPLNGQATQSQDMLMHTLLERDARHQVMEQRRKAGKSLSDKAAIKQETQEHYHRLVANLAPYNLVSHGPEDDRHAAMRQRISEGLDQIASTAPASAQAMVPQPIQRLLTNATQSSFSEPGSPAALFENMALGMPSQVQSRYMQDFEEIDLLGKGGFGEVYRVRHKLDNCVYAVKKIPIRASSMARIAAGGQAALDELLAEVRSLSRLQHPNVVRYHNSWIEWSTRGDLPSTSTEDLPESRDILPGAEDSTSFDSLQRIKTQSDTVEDIGFTFEASHSRSSVVATMSEAGSSRHAAIEISRSTTEFTNGALMSMEPSLALHMQMSVHPMNLAEFLSPPQSDNSIIKPLAHCFHLEPSVRILLALLDGVEYLHAEGVVHRDLKPANIFLRHEENPRAMQGCVDLFLCSDCRQDGNANPAKLSVCIGDFGLVTQITEPEALSSSETTNAVGTEIYRPTTATPPASPRLDIFALGIIACELLCKFGTQMERRQTLQSLRQGEFPKKFASCAGHQSTKVRDCVSAMLSGDADNMPTIPELKRRLSDVLAQSQKLEVNEVLRRSST